jgi:hypothetical protein
MRGFVLASLLLSFLLAMSACADKQPDKDDITVSNQRVQKLFDAMREGKYNNTTFPDLKWEDIPALLEMSAGKRVLKNFPVNPLSSILVKECPEGMVALSLVEGVRKGGKQFPSLTPFCRREGDKAENGTEALAKNQDLVLKAYKEWWKQVQSLAVFGICSSIITGSTSERNSQ